MFFSSLFKQSDKSVSNIVRPSIALDIVQYSVGLVSVPDAITKQKQAIDALIHQEQGDKEAACAAIYLELEHYLTEEEPIHRFTQLLLRQKIREKFHLDLAEEGMGLLFLPNFQQTVKLAFLVVNRIITEEGTIVGATYLREILKQPSLHPLLKEVLISDTRVDSSRMVRRLASLPEEEHQPFLNDFSLILSLLHKKMSEVKGQKSGTASIETAYLAVKNIYISYLQSGLSRAASLLPSGVLEDEKVKFLSREVLESEVKKKTDELSSRINDAEKQNKALEETKKVMMNLLEDSRELEKDLKEERDRAKTILSSMGEGLMVINKDHSVLLMNPAAEKLLGYTFESVKGKSWTEVVKVYKGDRELTTSERPVSISLRDGVVVVADLDDDLFFLDASGRKFPVAVNTSPLRDGGNITGAISVFRDITNEKEVKNKIEQQVQERTQELQEEHARLEASINSLNVGFIMTDNKNNIITMNGTARRLLFREYYKTITPAEVINKLSDTVTLHEIQSQLKDSFNLEETIQKCFNEKKPIEQTDIPMGDKVIHIFLAPIVILKSHLEMIGTVVLVEDITEEKLLQRSRDEFFSIASHELRTPLTAIKGNTSMIRDMYADVLKDPDLKSMIEDIYSASNRLINIVNEFLNMSRLELGKITFKNEAFDIVSLVQSSIKEVGTIADDKHIYLKLDGEITGIAEGFADKDKLKEVVMNLLGNAVKFTDVGGVTVHIQNDAKNIKVSITDTGKGVPMNNQNLLFRKFQQASNNILTRDTTRSTGLGLYISKLMMEGMGGKIYLEHSEENKGSTFTIQFPVATKDAIEAATKEVSQPENTPQITTSQVEYYSK